MNAYELHRVNLVVKIVSCNIKFVRLQRGYEEATNCFKYSCLITNSENIVWDWALDKTTVNMLDKNTDRKCDKNI